MIMPAQLHPEPQDGKLTKKYFMSLPTGVYLVSNVGESPWEPSFAGYVAPVHVREKQWQQLRDLRVDRRACHIFENRAAFDAWLERVFPRPRY
jgi:hypothetical protein